VDSIILFTTIAVLCFTSQRAEANHAAELTKVAEDANRGCDEQGQQRFRGRRGIHVVCALGCRRFRQGRGC
jgi:hypothetical protein